MCVSVFQKKFHNDVRLFFSHGHQIPYSVTMLAIGANRTICWFSHASMFSLIVVVIIIIIITKLV